MEIYWFNIRHKQFLSVSFKLQGPAISKESCEILRRCLEAVSVALISNERKLNELDSVCGDGDTGTTLRRIADGQ